MNVKLTVTVPMEKIHLKIGEMLEDVARELDNTAIDTTSISKSVYQQADFLKQMDEIDKIRKKMALLDANLEDCYNVINGLLVYKTKQKETEISSNASNGTKTG